MNKGKNVCKVLKAIRKQITDANGISYHPRECHYQGECSGTCPACESEVKYIECQLQSHRLAGITTSVVGVAIGACTWGTPTSAIAQTPAKPNTITLNDTICNKVKIVDLAPADTSAVVIRGRVVDENKEAIIGLVPLLNGTKTKTHTDIDGYFAVRVPRHSIITFSYIGYLSQKIKTDRVHHDLLIVMKEDKTVLLGEVVVLRPPLDDVYGHNH